MTLGLGIRMNLPWTPRIRVLVDTWDLGIRMSLYSTPQILERVDIWERETPMNSPSTPRMEMELIPMPVGSRWLP